MQSIRHRNSLLGRPIAQQADMPIDQTAARDGCNDGSATFASVQRPRAAQALILAVAFMVVLDFSIVNVALAAIERELHADATAVQWVITAYAITFGGLLVLGGRMGDLWGRRRMFAVGLVLFSVASLAGGLSDDLKMLVVARALQGVGAAIVAPAALSLITTTTPQGSARNRALGYYGATASIGFVAGLVLGGLLVQIFDWRAVLWVNVPIGLAAALLTPFLIPAPTRITQHHRLDVPGALLVTGGVAAAVYAISEGPVSGWLSGPAVGAVALAIALIGTFFVVERRHPAPLVRLGILQLRSLRTANLYTLLIGAWSAGELLVVPLYLQLVHHYSPLLTGLAMAPQGIVGFLGATRGARIVQKVGVRLFLFISALSAATGLLIVGLVLESGDYPFLVVGLMLAGYGTSTGSFGATIAATRDVADDEQGLAGGLINMSRQVGAAIGVTAVAAMIGAGSTSGGAVAPDRLAVLVISLAAVLGAVVAFHGIGERIRVAPRHRRTSGQLESTPIAVLAVKGVDRHESKGHRRLETSGSTSGFHDTDVNWDITGRAGTTVVSTSSVMRDTKERLIARGRAPVTTTELSTPIRRTQ